MLSHKNGQQGAAHAPKSKSNDRPPVSHFYVLDHELGHDHTLKNAQPIRHACPDVQPPREGSEIRCDDKERNQFSDETESESTDPRFWGLEPRFLFRFGFTEKINQVVGVQKLLDRWVGTTLTHFEPCHQSHHFSDILAYAASYRPQQVVQPKPWLQVGTAMF